MADEQFHFANNKWDVIKNNNNKNKKQEKKINKYEQSLENSQNKL